jgi:uncharacterized protein YecE (DUF72 family)
MNNTESEIRIGTSGYSFPGWQGNFYPEKIDKGKMLDHYVNYFSTVEINSTYYRIPHPAVMYNIVKKAPKGFDFIVKVPQSFTHRRTDLDKDISLFHEAIKPINEANKLSGLLAQFPYSFKFSSDSLDYISICKDIVYPIPLFVEFRHNSWVNRSMYDRLKSENIGYVAVDEPDLPGLLKPDAFATTNTAYIRLHGRNKDKWWDGGDLRYDYDYSSSELEDWRDKTIKLKAKVKKVYIFFNNCHHGQAAKNALEFKSMLGL